MKTPFPLAFQAICLRRTMLATTAMSAILAAGCGSGGSRVPSTTVSNAFPLSRSTSVGGLTATLTEDRDTVAAGGNVTFTLTLTNQSTKPITYLASVGCFNAYQVINGISSTIVVTNTSSATQSTLPFVEVTCNAVGLPVSTTLEPGASVTGTVNSGSAFATAGQYSVSASVADIASADATASPLTTGPLTVTVQ